MRYTTETAKQIVDKYNEGNCSLEQKQAYEEMVAHAQNCAICFNCMPNPWCWEAFADDKGIFALTLEEVDTTGSCEPCYSLEQVQQITEKSNEDKQSYESMIAHFAKCFLCQMMAIYYPAENKS